MLLWIFSVVLKIAFEAGRMLLSQRTKRSRNRYVWIVFMHRFSTVPMQACDLLYLRGRIAPDEIGCLILHGLSETKLASTETSDWLCTADRAGGVIATATAWCEFSAPCLTLWPKATALQSRSADGLGEAAP